MKNYFGLDIPDMKTILADPTMAKTIQLMLKKDLINLGTAESRVDEIVQDILTQATLMTPSDYEAYAYNRLKEEGVTDAFSAKLFERTQLMYSQIKPYLLEGSVLDLGCGDGKVGQLAAEDGFDVTLADVFEHPNITNTGLPFREFAQGEAVPAEQGEFDNTLSLYVYHHSDDPLQSFLDAKRVTKSGGRIIVLESVYDVDGKELNIAQQEKATTFLSLSAEQQRWSNTFFDYFGNRVLMNNGDPEKKINVPFNFNTPQGWKDIFEGNGVVQEEIIHLGIDLEMVQEYHTLHILRVQ